MRRSRLRPVVPLILALGVVAAVLPASAAQAAPSLDIDFSGSGYTAGTAPAPGGQNGWSSLNSTVDFALVDNADFAASGLPAGGRSLRFSNAVNTGTGANLVSPLIDSAGESLTANTFSTSFTVASATGALQTGLGVDVAIDGPSRFGGVLNLRHTSAGLAIGSYWVPADAPNAALSSWRSTVFTTVDPTVPHTITWKAIFLPGQADVVEVTVDGVLVSAGTGVTTWETYHAIAQPTGDRTVDSISFKSATSAPSASGVAYDSWPVAPAVAGQGLLFSGISYNVSTQAPALPTAPPVLAPTPATPDAEIPLTTTELVPGATIDFSVGGFTPFENVFVTFYSTPVFGGWFQADASGVVTGSVAVPAGLSGGSHTFQLTGAASGFIAAQAITIAALASAGPGEVALVAGGAGLLLVLGFALTRRRRA